MLSKSRKTHQRGFFQYIALIVVVILILAGLRVDIRRYGEEHHIISYIEDSKRYMNEYVVSPVKWFWTDRVKPFLDGRRFGKLRVKIQERTTLEDQ